MVHIPLTIGDKMMNDMRVISSGRMDSNSRLAQPAKSQPLRVVIADDHEMVREGLRRSLESHGLKVIGEAQDGAEAVVLVRNLSPDILLLDLKMPRHPGLETLRDLCSNNGRSSVRIMVLTGEVEKLEIVEALQLGARAVVMKDSATRVLVTAIEAVMSGIGWVGMDPVPNLKEYLEGLKATKPAAPAKRFGLTVRELEITRCVASGMSNRDIADHCGITEDTVKHHLYKTFNQTGVSTRTELAVFAVTHGLF